MPVFRSLWKGLRTYAWFVAAAWVLLVAVSTAQLLLTGSFELGNAFGWALRDWLPWVGLAPLVAWLSVIFPFGRKTWPLSLLVHTTACIVVVVAASLAARWLTPLPPDMPRGFEWRGERSHFSGRRFGPGGGPGGPGGPPGPIGPGGLGPMGWRMGFDFQRARMQVPIYWLIVSVMAALGHYRRSQEKDRRAAELSASLAKANLQALQHQLQPHFLFNALNSIAALVHTNPSAADDMIANLSELLRMSLDLSLEPETTLRREMEILSCYLDIERARFQDRLEVSVTVEPAALDAWMPALLLQPLVENAVRHGLEAKAKRAPIEIAARIEGGNLRLTVADSGPGLVSLPDGSVKEGIGLSNTRARLRELYGDRGVLRIENAPTGGCIATAILPHHVKPITEPAVALH